MRYVVIGAGAVGGTIGGRLHAAGHQVVLVARGAHGAALRERGLRLAGPDGTRTLPVPVASGPEDVELSPDDVLVLAVKLQDAAVALDAWATRPVTGGGTAGELLPLVCAQNGVDGERQALRRFARVYGMCVWLPSQYLEPGLIVAPCAPQSGVLHLGRYPGGGPDDTARKIAADLAESGFSAPLPGEVMSWKYGKLLLNLGNAAEAVCGEAVREGAAADLLARCRAEGEKVLAAAGITPPSAEEQSAARERSVPRPVPGAGRGGGSSWQSLVRGTGSVEADYLNGEIVLLGRMHGVPTPVNAGLQRAATALAREGGRPGALTVAELAARCGPG